MASISEDSGEETPLQVRFLFIVFKGSSCFICYVYLLVIWNRYA